MQTAAWPPLQVPVGFDEDGSPRLKMFLLISDKLFSDAANSMILNCKLDSSNGGWHPQNVILLFEVFSDAPRHSHVSVHPSIICH